jgi:hypothetical protein
MDRRYFLRALGTATGALFVPARFLLKAERYYQLEHRPLLVTYPTPDDTFFVDESGTLHLGDPYEDMPSTPTWREWFLDHEGLKPSDLTASFLEDSWDITPADLDQEMSEDAFFDNWLRHQSSTACAYYYFQYMNIGPDTICPDSEEVGSLVFTDCPSPGNDSLLVQVDGHLALPCLQRRLKQLGYLCNFQQV